MNVQAQKAMIIEQVNQMTDASLINAIKNLLDYASKKEADVYDISAQQQRLVMNRFNKIRKNPERMLDWDEAKKSLE